MDKKIIHILIIIIYIYAGTILAKEVISGNLGIKGSAILFALLFFTIYTMKIKNYIYLLLFLNFIYPFLQRYFNIPSLPSLTIPILSFLGYIIYIFIKKGNWFKSINYLEVIAFIIIVIVAVSSILSSNNMLLMVKSILEYFLPNLMLGVILSKSNIGIKNQKQILNVILGLLIIQIPVTVLQALTNSGSADANNGTISASIQGGTGMMAVLMTLLFSYYFVQFLLYKSKSKYVFFGIFLAPIPIIVGSARFGFVLLAILPIIASFSIFIYRNKKLLKLLFPVIVSAIFIVSLFNIVKDYLPKLPIKGLDVAFTLLTDSEKLLVYSGYYKQRGRLGDYLYLSSMQKRKGSQLMGLGGGSIVSSKTVGAKGAYEIGVTTMGLKIYASLGIAGVILFLIIFVYIINRIFKYLHLEADRYYIIWGISLLIYTFSIILSSIYTRIWDSQVGLTFFIILGILMNRNNVLVKGNNEIIRNKTS